MQHQPAGKRTKRGPACWCTYSARRDLELEPCVPCACGCVTHRLPTHGLVKALHCKAFLTTVNSPSTIIENPVLKICVYESELSSVVELPSYIEKSTSAAGHPARLAILALLQLGLCLAGRPEAPSGQAWPIHNIGRCFGEQNAAVKSRMSHIRLYHTLILVSYMHKLVIFVLICLDFVISRR